GGKVEGRTGYALAYPLAHILTGALCTTDNEELQRIGVNAEGPFAIIHSAADDKPKLDYEKVDFKDVFGSGDKYAGKAVAFKAWYVQEARQYKDGSGNEYIKGFTMDTHRSIDLRGIPAMKSGVNTILGFVEIGTAGDNYFKGKVATKRGTRSKTKKTFVVKGVIKKPGGFIREGALVMEVHELGKK
ncbi:MAG: hypothetical protein GY731_01480, partial [Gammaproteobacteria bacterium]|nr:hypothetical protein [Gammaproteobacteria bacterium]